MATWLHRALPKCGLGILPRVEGEATCPGLADNWRSRRGMSPLIGFRNSPAVRSGGASRWRRDRASEEERLLLRPSSVAISRHTSSLAPGDSALGDHVALWPKGGAQLPSALQRRKACKGEGDLRTVARLGTGVSFVPSAAVASEMAFFWELQLACNGACHSRSVSRRRRSSCPCHSADPCPAHVGQLVLDITSIGSGHHGIDS